MSTFKALYDRVLGGGGTFKRETIEHLVVGEEKMAELFSKKG